MSEMRIKARAMSWDFIGQVADAQRRRLGLFDVARFPVIDIVERLMAQELCLFEFLVGSKDEMGNNYGLTHPEGDFIMLREDVYIDACNDEPRARWTAGHELGHWTLHAGQPLARSSITHDVKPYENVELQAHQYAAELFMPRHLIRPNDTTSDLIDRFGVSHEAASRRIVFLRKKGLIK